MGIARFSSRVRDHGSITTIGRKGDQRNDLAIIDGPSLAHALLKHIPTTSGNRHDSILPQYSYAAAGKAAIDWLESLEDHGFTV